jgi:hypothetical protein
MEKHGRINAIKYFFPGRVQKPGATFLGDNVAPGF